MAIIPTGYGDIKPQANFSITDFDARSYGWDASTLTNGSFGDFACFGYFEQYFELTVGEPFTLYTYNLAAGETMQIQKKQPNGSFSMVAITNPSNYETWCKTTNDTLPAGVYRFFPYQCNMQRGFAIREIYVEKFITSKFLIIDNDVIKTIVSNSLQAIPKQDLATITVDDFLNHGIDNLSTITKPILSMLSNQFKIINWNDINLKQTIRSKCLSYPKLVTHNTDIPLATIQNINQVTASATNVKLIVSIDCGATWMTWNDSSWTSVEFNIDSVSSNGLSTTAVNSLTRQNWLDLVGSSKNIRFGYLLNMSTIEDVVNSDSIKMNVDMKGSWDGCAVNAEYKYSYATSSNITVKLLESGDYKINY